jgi:hypothetical protein
MQILARGWKRDHGTTQVAVGDLGNAVRDHDELMHYDEDMTYVRVLPPRPLEDSSSQLFTDKDCEQTRVRISMSHAVSLNGKYQVQCLLTKRDVADLFQLTHAQDTLDEVARTLNNLRENRPIRRRKI